MGLFTKVNKKRNKLDKDNEGRGMKNKVATFSPAGRREANLPVKEELLHPAITESLSPH